MNKAFTMVELIFVIVILGILAAVAIPKLSATRDDAKISEIAHSISTAATEIASYAVAKGSVDSDLSSMSNAIASLESRGEASLDVPNSLAHFKMGTRDDCITMQVMASPTDMNLTLSFGLAGDHLCDSLQGMFDTSTNVIPLKGKYIVQ